MDNLLYFPYISIPKTPWLYKSLLYWDSVETITPEYFLRNPKNFNGSYMRELLAADLVRPVMPLNYIYDIPNFKEDFLDYVDKKYEPKKEIYKRRAGGLVNVTRIHLEKMDSLGYELVNRELAYYKNGWFFIHKSISNDFMFYLASLIGEKRKSQPITDSPLQIKTTMAAGTQNQRNLINREEWRRTIINHVFPTPVEMGSVQELYDFKQKNGAYLKHFRKHIERELLQIDSAPEYMKDELLQNLLIDIEEEKQSISSKMQDKWKVFDTATLIQLTANGATLTNAYLTGTNLAIAGAALTITNTVITSLKKMGKNEADILSSPLAYAFIVEKRWNSKRIGKVIPESTL